MRLVDLFKVTILIAFGTTAFAQSITCTFDDIVSRWGVGEGKSFRDIDVEGDIATVTENGGLTILDIADPANPQLLGQWQGDPHLYDVDISGDLAFCTSSGDEAFIYDISDPSTPSLLSQIVIPSYVQSVEAVGDVVYGIWLRHGLYSFDISDPTNPVQLGAFSPDPRYFEDFDVDGGIAILKSMNEVWIVDVSDPVNMQELSSIEFVEGPRDVHLFGSFAFLTFGDEGLEIWDISNPTVPVRVSTFPLPSGASRVYVDADTAVVGMGNRGSAVLDISTPSSPELIGLYDPQGAFSRMYVADGLAYFATSVGLEVFDISDPPPPAVLVTLEVPSEGLDVAVHNNHAFVASNFGGLTIFDVTDPLDPQQIGTYESDNRDATAKGIQCRADRAYVASGRGGMEILDISTPSEPIRISSANAVANGVHIVDNLAFLAHYGFQTWIYDISDELNPVLLSKARGGGMCVDVHENYGYFGWRGVHIYDVSNPTDPVQVGMINSYDIDFVRDVLYHEGYLYVAHLQGVSVYDVSDPANPVETFWDDSFFIQKSLAIRNDRLWAAGDFGIIVYDIQPLGLLQFAGTVTPGERLGAISLDGDYAYFLEQREDYGEGVSAFFVINVGSCRECPPDFDNNGIVDGQDFVEFLDAWLADEPSTDFDNNGIIDTRDFIEFLNLWSVGC